MELSTDGKERVDLYAAELERDLEHDRPRFAHEMAVVKVRVELIVELLERMTAMMKGLLP